MIIGGKPQPLFEWNATTGILQINTALMTLRFQNGAVVGIYDNQRQLYLIDGDQHTNMPSNNIYFIGKCSAIKTYQQMSVMHI